jgi:hypothetical protein
MYSKQEASQLRQEFWTTFGRYMSPVLSAEQMKINWLNYKTGEKNIQFKMEADNKTASVSIQLTHKDEGLRELYFEQFVQFQTLLHDALGEKWNWRQKAVDEYGIEMSRISKEISEVNIFNKEQWPALISFFKPRIIALDQFWSSAKYGFEALR